MKMLLNRFFIKVLIRVMLIVISSVILAIVLQHIEQGYYFTLSGMVFLIFFQAYMLVVIVNKTNYDLEIFFSSVQDHNSSVRFSSIEWNDSFKKLHDKMNSLNTIMQNTRIENERTGHFLQSVVDHIDIGLLSFDMKEEIGIYNKAAKRYLNAQSPLHLSSLRSMNTGLFKIIDGINPGQEVLYKMKINNLIQSILIKATELKYESNKIKLVSFQDITTELDKKELESWKRLIRVLTHEIMNSISPITSLSTVISGYFKNEDGRSPVKPEEIDQQIITRTLSGLSTIEETGSGLLEFVDRYRSLTLLPKPNLSRFTVESLFSKCKMLMESDLPENIRIVTVVYPENIILEADYAQVEQILINLVKNAIEALSGKRNGTIRLVASSNNKNTLIQVEDNGTGIPPEIIEDIFVPFYTTKENGSGIGLSLSKQIMQNHNGTISVTSVQGEGSRFTLRFNIC